MIFIKSSKMRHLWIEEKLVRVPEKVRKELNVSLGEFLRFENDVVLQVDTAYKSDIEKYGEDKLFVSESVLESIQDSKSIEVVNTITMGCDPELFIINRDTNNVINPAHFFKKWDAIGCDGMLCELRPNPHINPLKVTDTIRGMINKINTRYSDEGLNNLMSYGASAAYGLTAGFHCHMGIPKNFLDKRAKNYQKFVNVIVKTLDYYVGVLSVIPEGTEENQRRCGPFVSYGKVSDHRVDNRTLEYRVPGGTLLKSPELTNGLISLCSAVTTDVVSQLKDYTNDFKHTNLPEEEQLLKELYPNVPDLKTLFSLICSPDTIGAENISESIMYDISKMVSYQKHKKSIITFKENLKKNLSNDIWQNWKKTEEQ